MPPTTVRTSVAAPNQPRIVGLVRKLQTHAFNGGEVGDAASRPLTDELAVELTKRAFAQPLDFFRL
ncbi:MAG: hypothetical protein JWL95_1157 [Gemmatimonadetes bacterium]|nr:hypothetical protein [Gemmatimonadota bacterium]